MASILEQYEQFGGNRFSQRSNTFPEVTTSGFINATLEEETPIFKKVKINFTPIAPVTNLVANNNQLVLAMANKTLLWINLKDADNPIEVKIGQYPKHKIHQLFLDPTGKFLVISLAPTELQGSAENLLLIAGSSRPVSLNKSRGHEISAIAWNSEPPNDTSTGFILAGTTKGLIFETELALRGTQDLYWKQVCDIGLSRGKIIGLVFNKIFGSANNQYFVLVTTSRHLYEFKGFAGSSNDPPVLLNLFTHTDASDIQEKCIEFPGDPEHSTLEIFAPSFRAPPKTFAWMTEPGVYFGQIAYKVPSTEEDMPKDKVVYNINLIQYPESGSPPISMVLTEFHALLAYLDKIKIINVLNSKLVMEDIIPENYLPLVGVRKDTVHGHIWAFTESAVFRYTVTEEDRDVWEVYLEKEEYTLAKKYCKNQPDKLDKVNSKQAQDFFDKKMYKESAALYAITHSPFEEIALKFMQLEEEEALKIFLLKKLETLRPQDRSQITMLVFWLLELYLNWLGTLRRSSLQRYELVQADFHNLLKQKMVKETITANCRAVYNLISNHGDEENLIYFINLMEDYEKVINYHLQHKNYSAALEVLSKKGNPELFYRFSPSLMQASPEKTVGAWILQGDRLRPTQLVPALLQTSSEEQDREVMRYLEFCVYQLKNKDKSIHNFLLALYARMAPDKLMNYLELQGQDEESVPYDLKYALRLCSELGLKEACVHIYALMGLYEEAVDVALGVDIELAKANADKPENNEELVKKLWLKIAKHVVKEENDIQRAMEFLKDCDFIKIEDILPFFPDFVTIDHFKEAICKSLQEYNEHIEFLIQDMDQATNSAAEIKSEIQEFRNRSLVVRSEEKCAVCNFHILTRSFYLFPCHHTFHVDCLIHEVNPYLTQSKQVRVAELQKELTTSTSTIRGAPSVDDSISLSSLATSREKLQAELDDLVASECIFCGEIMIRCVDVPFIDPQEYSQIVKSWE